MNPRPSPTPHPRLRVPTPARVAGAATLAWLVLAAAAIANGALRESVLSPWMGEAPARLLSIALLVGIILVVSLAFARAAWTRLPYATLLLVGASWAAGSVLFEFGLGRLVLDVPWSELLAAYDLTAGEYWVLAPLTMLVGPALARGLLARRGE